MSSAFLRETSGSLMKSRNSLNMKQDDSDRAATLGVPILTLEGDKIEIIDNVYEITPEIHKAFSSTGYTGRNLKVEY